jgi:hypothetical protein
MQSEEAWHANQSSPANELAPPSRSNIPKKNFIAIDAKSSKK